MIKPKTSKRLLLVINWYIYGGLAPFPAVHGLLGLDTSLAQQLQGLYISSRVSFGLANCSAAGKEVAVVWGSAWKQSTRDLISFLPVLWLTASSVDSGSGSAQGKLDGAHKMPSQGAPGATLSPPAPDLQASAVGPWPLSDWQLMLTNKCQAN